LVKENKMSNVSGINILNYGEFKASGLLSIVKVGNAFVVSVKRFNVETGNEEEPQVIAISIDQIKESRENLLLQISGLDKIISDMELLKEKP